MYIQTEQEEAYGELKRSECPNWAGWRVIDTYKKSPLCTLMIDELLKGNQEFQSYLVGEQ